MEHRKSHATVGDPLFAQASGNCAIFTPRVG
jgi:hypothetical protein